MKYRLYRQIKKSILLTLLSGILGLCSTSFAASDSAPPANANPNTVAYTNWLLWTLSQYINNAVNASVQTHKKLIYQPTPNLDSTLSGNVGQSLSIQTTRDTANQDLLDSLKLMVTTSDNTDIVNAAAKQVPVSVSTANTVGAGFNLNALLDATNLNAQAANHAKNYIAFASGLVKPHEVLPPAQMLSHANNLSAYKTQLGIATARSSASISTLYQLLAERTPQAGLGTLSKITVDSNGQISFADDATIPADASELQVAQYNAQKRADNPNWYRSMETATPATLQRETLYTMADIQKSLFDLHLAMERQTALLALVALQQNEAQQKTLLESDKQAVTRAYNTAKAAKSR